MNTEQPTEEGRRVKKRYSAEDREKLIKEFEESGLTRQAFCEGRGLKLTTFHGWFKMRSKEPTGFAEVEVTEAEKAPIEIGLSGGLRLGIYLNGDQAELIKLCRGILGC
jgi:hypothetical protein